MIKYISKFTLTIAVSLSITNFYCTAMEKEAVSEGAICTLPPEMGVKLCSYLSSPADLSSMAQVSHSWSGVLKSVYDSFDKLKNIFVIGGLGSGVSSLSLLLAGKKLDVDVRVDYGGYLFKCSEDNVGINIAHGSNIGTYQHTCIYADNIGKIWDCSSFQKDYFGPEADFLKAQNLQGLLSGPVKVIIAIEEPFQLHGWGDMGIPMAVLNRVAEMFIDLDQLKKIATLVITKSRGRFTYTKMLEAFLTIKERYAGQYTKNFTELLRYFLNNPEKVKTFPKPTVSGPYGISLELQSLVDDNTFVLNPSINAPTLAAIHEDRWCETAGHPMKQED